MFIRKIISNRIIGGCLVKVSMAWLSTDWIGKIYWSRLKVFSLGLLASLYQDMLSASMDDDLLLLGQVSAQPSHTNSDWTSTNDPVTDLVYPVLSPVHSVRSWVLPGEITSKCKADMDIDVNQSQFSLMMAFLKKS